MNLNPGLQIFHENETSIYLAPKASTIAVSVQLNGSYPGKFSKPFLIKDQDSSGLTYYDNFDEKIILNVGRYLKAVELETIKKKTLDFLADTELTGTDLKDVIHTVVKSVELEFDQPSEPHQIIPDEPIHGDPEFLPCAMDDDLAKYAYLVSERCIPYMHPWDAYEYLLLLREKALKKAGAKTVVELNSYF